MTTPDRAPDVLTLDFDAATAPNHRYVELHSMLHNAAGKRVARRKLQNNTYAERMADQFGRPAIGVRFHDTFVVVNSAFTITLNTGGFGTATTRERINAYTPASVSIITDKGSWMVRTTKGTVPFVEGMTLHWDDEWSFESAITDDVAAQMTAHNKATRIIVEAWLRDMPDALADDAEHCDKFQVKCASCCYVDRQQTRTIADEFENHEHLLRHMVDREWPEELIKVAMREARMVPILGVYSHNFGHSRPLRHENAIAIRRALRHYVLLRTLTGVLTQSGYATAPGLHGNPKAGEH
jgi:hypothetical protein